MTPKTPFRVRQRFSGIMYKGDFDSAVLVYGIPAEDIIYCGRRGALCECNASLCNITYTKRLFLWRSVVNDLFLLLVTELFIWIGRVHTYIRMCACVRMRIHPRGVDHTTKRTKTGPRGWFSGYMRVL